MNTTTWQPLIGRMICFVMGGLAFFATVQIASQSSNPSFGPSPATAAEPRHDEDEHTLFESLLRKEMSGPVDVYIDVAEVESNKPLLANVMFDGLVDVTGKHLLRFSDDKGQRWLIDPDTVLTYRIQAKRSPDKKKRR